MPSLGMWELLVILIIVLLIFGVGKLPQVGEGLGKAIRGFRRSVTEPESKEKTGSQKEPDSMEDPPKDSGGGQP